MARIVTTAFVLSSLLIFACDTVLFADDGVDVRNAGFDCNIPIYIPLRDPSEFRYIDSNTTCGMLDDYPATCLGYYDGGEDIIYEIDLDISNMNPLVFALDPMGSGWTGMVLSDECPPPGGSFEDCLAYSVSEYARPHSFDIILYPGTYYLMIDTWPSPDCIPEFELEIYFAINKCDNATTLELPEDAVYNDLNQTTCRLYNLMDETCMGYYDSGEERMYRINVLESATYSFRFDPKGTTYAAISLDTDCPPGYHSGNCLAFYSTETGDKIQFNLALEPNIYFLMIDTWASPDCIPDYDLTINLVNPPPVCGDASGDGNVNISDAVYIINYVFIGGPPPEPLQIADVNCDEGVNVADAVWIINYIFVGGNQPCDPDGNGVPNC